MNLNERPPPEMLALLREMLAQQTAMLQVQAETLRLQRVLVERLMPGAAPERRLADAVEPRAEAPPVSEDATSPRPLADVVAHPSAADAIQADATQGHATLADATQADALSSRTTDDALAADSRDNATAEASGDVPRRDPHPARGSRYYQPSAVAQRLPPEDVELMRRLQAMRDAADLILQFGPHKGATLAQVALHHPEYIRELMLRAQRPEVRAAAARLVEALDAADEHKRRAARGSANRGRPVR